MDLIQNNNDVISTKHRTSDHGLPSSWTLNSTGTDSIVFALAITILALVCPFLLYHIHKRYRNMQEENRKPFPFLSLPRELRDDIYVHLLEDPIYPLLPTPVDHDNKDTWFWNRRWGLPRLRTLPSVPKKSNWVMLANRQLYEEYTDLLCKKKTFHLTISPHNYKNHTSTEGTGENIEEDSPLWTISASTSSQIRNCELLLIASSGMLGVCDPRNMKSDDWKLSRQVRHELRHMTNVKTFTLNARAIGDPLWNPLWIWYHASQSFKDIGVSSTPSSSLSSAPSLAPSTSPPSPTADNTSQGPTLTKITFSLDSWSPGENHLERNVTGAWTWYCPSGHAVCLDGGPDITVRQFCNKLYQECEVCQPKNLD